MFIAVILSRCDPFNLLFCDPSSRCVPPKPSSLRLRPPLLLNFVVESRLCWEMPPEIKEAFPSICERSRGCVEFKLDVLLSDMAMLGTTEGWTTFP
jgi:hypothetical protein